VLLEDKRDSDFNSDTSLTVGAQKRVLDRCSEEG